MVLIKRTHGREATRPSSHTRLDDLRAAIEHAAHFLPSQGPIEVFIHHNTLHSFEHLSFDEGVIAGGRLYGCHAFLPEEHYREKLRQRRIRVEDLEGALLDDLGDDADKLVASFGTRFSLRLAMLRFPLRAGSPDELRWVIAETDALRRIRADVDPIVRERLVAETRRFASQRFVSQQHERDERGHDKRSAANRALATVIEQFGSAAMESWSDPKWEAFALSFLWRICSISARALDKGAGHEGFEPGQRHRDLLLEATGQDSDVAIHRTLIPFCSAFLDQGFSDWEMPDRRAGFYASFLSMYGKRCAAPTSWLANVRNEVNRLANEELSPLESIDESLTLLGVDESEWEPFVTRALLAQRGWAGMIWQLESNAEWAAHPAPAGSLIEYLAVRLALERLSVAATAREALGFEGPLDEVRDEVRRRRRPREHECADQRAFTLFQLAQAQGWTPGELQSLATDQWRALVAEVDAFSGIERRRIFHHAFERKFRHQTLDAIAAHARRRHDDGISNRQDGQHGSLTRGAYQIVCCIDEREESFRRHLEEIDPGCETFGIAGFFGVAMYYRGVEDAHFKPLCPVNVKPTHYVVERPLYSLEHAERRRAEARRRIGHATHQAHRTTRTFAGGLLIGLLGPLAAIPLVARVLFPRTTARILQLFGRMMRTPSTELSLERTESSVDSHGHPIGYTVEEMAKVVEGVLRAIGLAKSDAFSRMVIICGHGSSSLNNPHEAAHDCGACGGGRGGPNARAFAQMANDPRVRVLLGDRGIRLPDGTYFVGAYHNTCDDAVTWYDIDRIPNRDRDLFERAKRAVGEARQRNALERCRRFESADLEWTPREALRHVEGRAEDLSEPRPEYGHATNAICVVGRRRWTRGLFLDRRAFLASYDPTIDDATSSILERLLQAVIPVCAGINLEYYFSYVDPQGYGCGTKLPHNITSLVGVMDGPASDLRPGLPWQMVEVHEPVRLLFVIETTPAAMRRIIDSNPPIARLVNGGWVQLALFDESRSQIHHFVHGHFVPYVPESEELPIAPSSIAWFRGQRDHLAFASISDDPARRSSSEMTHRS